MNAAAFFDMDRTLLRVNTAALYVRWLVRRGAARRRDLVRMAFWKAKYTLGVLDAEALAARAAKDLRGRDEAAFRAEILAWVAADVLQHIAPAGRAEIARAKARGELCAMLTSATVHTAEPVAAALGIEHVLASRLAVDGAVFTGDFVRPLAYGPGKVLLAERWAAAHRVDLTASAFYTDSISDLPMLERVGRPVVVNPDPRLRWVAARRGWRVERW